MIRRPGEKMCTGKRRLPVAGGCEQLNTFTGTVRCPWMAIKKQTMKTTTGMNGPEPSSDVILPGVTKTGEVVSGADGAGPENNELDWAKRHVMDTPGVILVERKTELLGTGVQARKNPHEPAGPVIRADPLMDMLPDVREGYGDLAFLLIDRQDRIASRQNKKIDRLSRRLDELEASRRSP